MTERKLDIRGLSLDEIKSIIKSEGEKIFRASQVFHGVQARAVQDWPEMTGVGPAARGIVAKRTFLSPLELLCERTGQDGTRK